MKIDVTEEEKNVFCFKPKNIKLHNIKTHRNKKVFLVLKFFFKNYLARQASISTQINFSCTGKIYT